MTRPRGEDPEPQMVPFSRILLEFVSPVASEPNRLSETSLAVAIGPEGQEITVDLVTTLEGPQIF